MVRKKITKKIEISIEYDLKEDGVIAYNTHTVQFLWGSRAVPNDISDVKILKDGYKKKWFISFNVLKDRLRLLYEKLDRTKTSIDIIEQLLGEGKDEGKEGRKV